MKPGHSATRILFHPIRTGASHIPDCTADRAYTLKHEMFVARSASIGA